MIYFCLLLELGNTLLTKSEVKLKPCCPVWRILNEAQVFKKSVGDCVVLLYVAVHWVALSMQELSNSANQHFSVAFPSVLWQCVQHAQGTVIIHQNPGYRLTLVISDAAWRKITDEVFNVAVTLLIPSKLPGFIHQVNMGKVKRWNPWFNLTVKMKIKIKGQFSE